ncbi:MAG TPA: glycosyltransferase [Pirellulales bacterium]|nr:glycosyltransferase [Pirellulales bacterium]
MSRVLYLAPVEWASLRQRPQQLALRLARHFDVRYVEPVGLRSMRPADLGRIWRHATADGRASAPLPLVRPRYVPFIGHRLLDWANRRWLWRQMANQFDFDGGPWILWLSTPSLLAETLLEHTAPSLVVYDCMDRYAEFHRGRARQRIERAEAAIVGRADLVFASSRGLAERLDRWHEATLVPNGVETCEFAVTRRTMPDWRKRIRGPVVGFYGTIGDWLDFDLLAELARRRPDWSFVFAGPQASRDFGRLQRLANVHHLGVIPYDALPEQAAWFDVGLVPFRLNALTRYVHPIKALEYLALGLPIVSSALPDLAELANVVRFAATADEWLAAIAEALTAEARSTQAVTVRRQAAAAHDWDSRAAIIVGRLMERLPADQRSADEPTGNSLGKGRLPIANCELQIAN